MAEANTNDDEAVEESTEEKPQEEEKNMSALDNLPYSMLEKRNYKYLFGMFPEVIKGEKDYMKFKAESYDDMYIEKIGNDTYALCLFYIQNGDLMREPEYTFKIDREKGAARVLEWEMSSLGMYQCVYNFDNPREYKPDLKKDLDESFSETLKGIEMINYQPYEDYSDCDEETEI